MSVGRLQLARKEVAEQKEITLTPEEVQQIYSDAEFEFDSDDEDFKFVSDELYRDRVRHLTEAKVADIMDQINDGEPKRNSYSHNRLPSETLLEPLEIKLVHLEQFAWALPSNATFDLGLYHKTDDKYGNQCPW